MIRDFILGGIFSLVVYVTFITVDIFVNYIGVVIK